MIKIIAILNLYCYAWLEIWPVNEVEFERKI